MGILSNTTKARIDAAKKSVGSALAMVQKASDKIEVANANISIAMSEDRAAIADLSDNIKDARLELECNNSVLAKLREFLPSKL